MDRCFKENLSPNEDCGGTRMIYLIYATIRINTCIDNIQHWLKTCVNPENIRVKVAVNTEQEKEQFCNSGIKSDIIVTNSPRIGYCYSMNYLTKDLELQDDDILIFLADDLYSPDGWDIYIYDKFKDFKGCLMLDDGFQSTERMPKDCLPSLNIPAMTFSCLKTINKRLFSPEYTHFFADNELYLNMSALGLLKDDRIQDGVIFEHRHYWINGKRERDQYDMEYSKYASEDRTTFEKRKCFNVFERIV